MKLNFALVLISTHIFTLQASATEAAKAISPTTELETAVLEKQYIETRNNYIRHFSAIEITIDTDERPALADLESRLVQIVGPIDVKGFPKKGTINLVTLFPELGFGQVDGLRFSSDNKTLVVTTTALIDSYLVENPKLPNNMDKLSKSEDFYRLAFHSGAAVNYYSEVPVHPADGQSYAHAFLGVTAQDIGPFVPQELFVFVSNGKQIFLAALENNTEVTDIPQCRTAWEMNYKKRSDAYDAYLRSKPRDKKLSDNSIRYENQAFDAYRRCYGREAKNQKYFVTLKKYAQSMVDQLSK